MPSGCFGERSYLGRHGHEQSVGISVSAVIIVAAIMSMLNVISPRLKTAKTTVLLAAETASGKSHSQQQKQAPPTFKLLLRSQQELKAGGLIQYDRVRKSSE